jgi:succinate dehydrogenase / fumarate reductase cytochrome b subunit
MIGPYYRPQLTSMLSITHRATGVFLSLGTVLLVGWLMAAASGAETYAGAQQVLNAWYGQVLLLGWSFALFYHLCNGIRHLLWDAGKGFELGTAHASAIVVLIATAALTVAAWLIGYAV